MAPANKATLDRLGQVQLFRRCTQKDLEALAAIVDEVAVPAGAVLCDQGRVAEECFVVVEGEADIAVGGIVVASAGPGDPIGEMSLLDHLPRSATVTAKTPMQLYVIPAAKFDELVESTPIARGLLEHLSLRIRELEVGRRIAV